MNENLLEKYPHSAEEMSKNLDMLESTVSLEQIEELCQGNELLEELKNTMIDYFYRYAETVCQYDEILSNGLSEPEVIAALQNMENERSVLHTATMDSVNILARNMAQNGQDNSWVQKIGDSRAAYARFAITTIFAKLFKEQQQRLSQS